MDFDKIKGDVKIRAFSNSDGYFDGWLNVNTKMDSDNCKSDAKWNLSNQAFFKHAVCDVFYIDDFLKEMMKGDEHISFMLANIKNILRANGVFIVGLSDILNVVKLEKWLEKLGFDDVLFYDKKLDCFSRKHPILSDCQKYIDGKIPCFIKASDDFENIKNAVDEFVNCSDKLDIYILGNKNQSESASYYKELLEKDLIKKYVLFDEDIKENSFEEYLIVNKDTFSQYEKIILADCNTILKNSKWISELKNLIKYPEVFSASVLPNGVDSSSLKVSERDFKHSSDVFSCSMFKTSGFYTILKLLISRGTFFTRKQLIDSSYKVLRMSNALSNEVMSELPNAVVDNQNCVNYSGFTEYSKDGENRIEQYDRIYYI